MTSTYANKNVFINSCRKAVTGVEQHFGKAKTIVLDGESVGQNQLIADLKGAIAAIDATAEAEKRYRKAVEREENARAAAEQRLQALKLTVRSQLGAAALADFGFELKDRKKPTVETLAEAAKKRAATREARHTMGKRQREQLKGDYLILADSAGQPEAEAGPKMKE